MVSMIVVLVFIKLFDCIVKSSWFGVKTFNIVPQPTTVASLPTYAGVTGEVAASNWTLGMLSSTGSANVIIAMSLSWIQFFVRTC